MWKYRQQFWEDYLDNMYETRVILGPDAVELAQRMGQKLLNCAYLSRGSHDQSLLMFSIGQFVFIEVSHSGKLRVFLKDHSPVPFYESRKGSTYHIVKFENLMRLKNLFIPVLKHIVGSHVFQNGSE